MSNFCPTRCAYCSFVSQSVEKSMALVPEFLQEDSIFICSGILNTRLPEVLDALEKNGLQILSTEQQEDWCRVTAALLET